MHCTSVGPRLLPHRLKAATRFSRHHSTSALHHHRVQRPAHLLKLRPYPTRTYDYTLSPIKKTSSGASFSSINMAKLDIKVPNLSLPDGNSIPFVSLIHVASSPAERESCQYAAFPVADLSAVTRLALGPERLGTRRTRMRPLANLAWTL